MKEGLLDRIRALGHWRVNMRPIRPLAEKLSLGKCSELVEQSRVSIRGWDYPHISRRQDDNGGAGRFGDYIEHWCDWDAQIEFWRMYQSGQFLFYGVLEEDQPTQQDRPADLTLNVVGAIYSVAEFVEFAHRLHQHDLYMDGVILNVSIVGTAGRRLAAGRNRMPFLDPRQTEAPSVAVEHSIDADRLETGHTDVAVDVLLELFDKFGWNPAADQIRADLVKLYKRDWW